MQVRLGLDFTLVPPKKTNRLVILEEAWPFGNISTDISHKIQNELFDYLDAPIEKVKKTNEKLQKHQLLLRKTNENTIISNIL